MRTVQRITLLSALVIGLFGTRQPAGAGDPPRLDLAAARAQVEQRHYHVAIDMIDRYLRTNPQAADAGDARLLRAEGLRALRKAPGGTEGQPVPTGAPTTQPAMAESAGGAERTPPPGRERAQAIDYLGKAADLHVKNGEPLAAAKALRERADLLIGFDQWEQLTSVQVDKPADWTASRRLQRGLAIEALDRAIALAGEDELAASATFRKGEIQDDAATSDPAAADLALVAYRGVARNWPSSPLAGQALFRVGRLLERAKRDFAGAVREYERVIADFAGSEWAEQARQARRGIVAPSITLSADGPFRPGEPVDIHFKARNVTTVRLRAYRVELFDLARRTDRLRELGRWAPAGDAFTTWELSLPNDGQFAVVDSRAGGDSAPRPTRLPGVAPGAYMVVADADGREAHVRGTTLVLVSSLAAICTSVRQRCLVFAADALSGEPQDGADVLLLEQLNSGAARGYDGRTDAAGICNFAYLDPLTPGGTRTGLALIRRGEHYASCAIESRSPDAKAAYRSVTLTDRPVYEPGQVVHFKRIVRRVVAGGYDMVANCAATLQLRDGKGEVVDSQTLVIDDYGTIGGEWRLSDLTPPGEYTITMAIGGESSDCADQDQGARFRVEEQRPPEFAVTVVAEGPQTPDGSRHSTYSIGEQAGVTITARRPDGAPVADARVEYRVWRTPLAGGARDLAATGTGATDADGRAAIRFPTAAIESAPDSDVEYTVEAEVTDAGFCSAVGRCSLCAARTPFRIAVTPSRTIFPPGEPMLVELHGQAPDGGPFRFRGRARIYRLQRQLLDQNSAEPRLELGAEVFSAQVTMDARGIGQLEWTPLEEGQYRIVVSTQNQQGLTVSGAADVWVVQQGGRYPRYAYRDLEIVLDRPSADGGGAARLLINTRFDRASVLLTAQADDRLEGRMVFVAGGSAVAELPISAAESTRVDVTAALLRDGRVYRAQQTLAVPAIGRMLNVKMEADGTAFAPKQAATLEIVTTDEHGAPVSADITLLGADIRAMASEYPPDIRRAYGARTAARADASPVMPVHESVPFRPLVWRTGLRTDQEGKARVSLSLPDELATWSLYAMAVDRETRVGSGRLDLTAHKDVLARVAAPPFLIEQDEAAIAVTAANDLPIEKTVELELTCSTGGRIGSAALRGAPLAFVKTNTVQVVVPPRGALSVEFTAKVLAPGSVTFTAWARSNTESDSAELSVPVLGAGIRQYAATSGIIAGAAATRTVSVPFTLPEQMETGTAMMDVRLSASLAALLVDALPEPAESQDGGAENVLNGFVSTILVRATLARVGLDPADAKRHVEAAGGESAADVLERLSRRRIFSDELLRRSVEAGLARVASLQRGDGGWNWRGDDVSDAAVTARIVCALTTAADHGVAVDREMMRRGRVCLRDDLKPAAGAERRAWVLFALCGGASAAESGDLPTAAAGLFTARRELSDAARALLAMALHRLGDDERAEALLAELEQQARMERESDSAWWGGPTRGDALESTALVLRALLLIRPGSPLIAPAANWIARARSGAGWGSSRGTLAALHALCERLTASGAPRADMSASVRLDDRGERTVRFSPDNLLLGEGRLRFDARDLSCGPHRVTIEKTGPGELFFTVAAEFEVRPSGARHDGPLTMTRSYARLAPRRVAKTRTTWDAKLRRTIEEQFAQIEYERVPLGEDDVLRVGERVEVRLELESRDDVDDVIVEDPRAAGFEPLERPSTRACGDTPCTSIACDDRAVRFYLAHLPRGSRTLTYTLRCATPGTFTALPARIEAEYTPQLGGRTDSRRLAIAHAK